VAKTIVGLFDTYSDASNVVQSLIDNGFSRNDISVVAQNENVDRGHEVGSSSTAEAAGAGAVGGTVVGGLVGLLVGVGALTIPGIGPVLAAGPLAAAIGSTALGAGIGAAAGGLVGALIGAGVPEDDANFYAEGVRRGGTLVTVTADDMMADNAYSIMQRHGAVDINERGSQYRSGGWDRFDPNAGPYTRSDTATDAYTRRSSVGTGAEEDWQDSSKVGTAGGTVAGAASGAAMGSVAGPVGTVVGGVAGAAVGAGVGAAGDVAGERAEDSAQGEPGRRDRYADYDNDFRTDYTSNYASSGYNYDYFSPAYQYGYDLAQNNEYRNADWTAVEPYARLRWEDHNPNTWEQFKNAVHYAWNRARGRM
jgi:uncharacterized membrane protein